MADVETYCGIDFKQTAYGKEGARLFRFLPSEGDHRGGIELSNRDPRTPQWIKEPTPTAAQLQALQFFLDHEESICKEVLETVNRYLAEVRDDSFLFEDIPENPTFEEWGKFISFQEMGVLRETEETGSLIGLGFSCEWEMEHGLGIVLADGIVVDIGHVEVSFKPSGAYFPSGVLNSEQLSKSDEVFRKSGTNKDREAYQTSFKEMKDKLKEEKAEREYWNHGFPSVDALTELIENCEPQAVQVILDVPEGVIPSSTVAEQKTPSLTEKLKELLLMSNLKSSPALESGQKTVQIDFPFRTAGMEFVMWNTIGEVKQNQLDGGPWPGILLTIAKKWPGAVPQGGSVKIYNAQKQEQQNSELGSALLMALCEVLDVDTEKVLRDYEAAQH